MILAVAIIVSILLCVIIYSQYMIYKTLQELKVEKLLKLIEKVGEWV